MWCSNTMELTHTTAAEVVEGLTGIPSHTTMERMRQHQRSFPGGEKYPILSSYTACKLG